MLGSFYLLGLSSKDLQERAAAEKIARLSIDKYGQKWNDSISVDPAMKRFATNYSRSNIPTFCGPTLIPEGYKLEGGHFFRIPAGKGREARFFHGGLYLCVNDAGDYLLMAEQFIESRSTKPLAVRPDIEIVFTKSWPVDLGTPTEDESLVEAMTSLRSSLSSGIQKLGSLGTTTSSK